MPTYIAVATKEPVTNLEIIHIPQWRLDECLDYVRKDLPHIVKVKSGEIPAERCGVCDYCKQTKVLTGPIDFEDAGFSNKALKAMRGRLMRKITDLLGQKFGRLKVISLFGKDKYNNARWLCQCDCGNETIVIGSELRRTNRIGTRSCGCLQKERREHYNKNCKKYNDFLITNGYVEVTLYNSPNKMLCDIDDWERLKEHCWYECGGYARTNKKQADISVP